MAKAMDLKHKKKKKPVSVVSKKPAPSKNSNAKTKAVAKQEPKVATKAVAASKTNSKLNEGPKKSKVAPAKTLVENQKQALQKAKELKAHSKQSAITQNQEAASAPAPASTSSKESEKIEEKSSEKAVATSGPIFKNRTERLKAERLSKDSTIPAEKRWSVLQEQLKNIKPPSYQMGTVFEAMTPIQHKVLGWGFIVEKRENRIDVLFKDGIRTLVHATTL